MVHIFAAMEPCPSYRPWHDKQSGRTFLKPTSGKCLHYYFYFIDAALGLCYLRVPTWAPFRLQFYFNGHNPLAAVLRQHAIAYELVDNAFVAVADFARAQALADAQQIRPFHHALDRFARQYCPVVAGLQHSYHWSLLQVEYATDVVFTDAGALHDLYDALVRTAVHAGLAAHCAASRHIAREGTHEEATPRRAEPIERRRCRTAQLACRLDASDHAGGSLRVERVIVRPTLVGQ